MEVLNVLAAALGAYAFAAAWYIAMRKPWMAAAGIVVGSDGRPVNSRSAPMPFVIALVAMVAVAGMMRHTFQMGGIDSAGKGIVAGLGIGAFFITPWMAMNYAFSMRKGMLTVLDGVNAIVGCAIMGLILALF